MKLRKLFACVTVAATLLGGMAFGATTANAAEADFSDATIKVTTTDADQFYTSTDHTQLREFAYVKLASYATDGYEGVTLEEAALDNATKTAVDNAFAAINYDSTTDRYNNRWVWLGNQTSVDTAKFVAVLKDLTGTTITPTAGSDATAGTTTLTFDFGADGTNTGAGLYLILDKTGDKIVEENTNHTLLWKGMSPILAGTKITSANPDVSNKGGEVFAGEGQVNEKSTKTDTKKGGVTWTKTSKDRTQGIDGATFNVYEGGKAEGEKVAFVKVSDGTYRLPYTGEDATTVTDLTTENVKGVFVLQGLKASTTYTVVETGVPDGYNGQFKGSFTFKTAANAEGAISEFTGDAYKLAEQDKDGKITVVNVKNITELPLTGAAGTALFSVIGLLIAGAAVTVFAKSRSTKRALNA